MKVNKIEISIGEYLNQWLDQETKITKDYAMFLVYTLLDLYFEDEFNELKALGPEKMTDRIWSVIWDKYQDNEDDNERGYDSVVSLSEWVAKN